MWTETSRGGGGDDGVRSASEEVRTRRPARGRWRVAWTAAALVALASGVGATEGEDYDAADSGDVEALVDLWKSNIAPLSTSMCTGTCDRSRGEAWRDPDESLPLCGEWHPLAEYPHGEVSPVDDGFSLAYTAGEDTDHTGSDLFAMYRLVGIGANLFLRVVIEAEDDAEFAWKIRYCGTETVRVTNGPLVRADSLKVSNTYDIEWNRRIVDFDAEDGEFDEEKHLVQDFVVRADLIDGTSVGGGERFSLTRPDVVRGTSTIGLSASGTYGDSSGTTVGASFQWGEQKVYSSFTELSVSEREHAERGVVVMNDSLPCPADRRYECETHFDGDFVCHDLEDFSGDKGARQELLLTVINYVDSVTVTGCWPCGTTTPPPPPPPPTTPTDPAPEPAPVTTPSDPSTPGTPPAPTTPGGTTQPTTPVLPGDDDSFGGSVVSSDPVVTSES